MNRYGVQILRDKLVLAIAIMDDKGKSIGEDDASTVLWRRDWDRLRDTLLECVEMVEYPIK